MSEIEKHRGIGDVCRRGFHEKCPAPAACRCECHGEKAAAVEKYTCTACPESFDRASRLREHERRHIREGLIARQASEGPQEAPERPAGGLVAFHRPRPLGEPLACPEDGCQVECSGAQGLASHRRWHERSRSMTLDDEQPGNGQHADGEPAGTLTLSTPASWPTAIDEPPSERHAIEYDARMAALADDVELAWPHRCAERYVLLLIDQLAEHGTSWNFREALCDRIERVLGLHPTEP